MQLIDLNALHLITPLHFSAGVLLHYYSPIPIQAKDILFREGETGIELYRVQVATCVEQRREIIIGADAGHPIKAKCLARLYLRQVSKADPKYRELYDQTCDAQGIPF